MSFAAGIPLGASRRGPLTEWVPDLTSRTPVVAVGSNGSPAAGSWLGRRTRSGGWRERLPALV
jgi:hypothetical protein